MPKRQAPYYQHASQSTEGSTGQAGPSGSQDSIVANNRVFGRLISYASVTSASGQKAYYWIQSQPAANGAWADDSYGLACTAVASGQQTGYAWEVNGTSTLTANSIVELEPMGGVLDARGESWRIVLSSQGASSFTLAGRTGTQTINNGDTMTLANGVVTATDTWTPDTASGTRAGIVDLSSSQQLGTGTKITQQLAAASIYVDAANPPTLTNYTTIAYTGAAGSDGGISVTPWGGGVPGALQLWTSGDPTTGISFQQDSDTRVATYGRFLATVSYSIGENDGIGGITEVHGATGTSGGGDTVKGGIVTALGSALTGFTDELAQDAVGTILVDSSTIDLTYNDGTPSITAAAIYQMSITADASGLKLSGDSASPGNSYYYGTDSGGTKGFYTLPQAADVGALTDSTGGTANTTLVAIAGTGDDTNLNDNFADLVAQINALRTALRNAGLMA